MTLRLELPRRSASQAAFPVALGRPAAVAVAPPILHHKGRAARAMVPVYDFTTQQDDIWKKLLHQPTEDARTQQAVREIIDDVRRRGDEALLEFTSRFDDVELTAAGLRLAPEVLEDAWNSLPSDMRAALQTAADRIRAFHERQRRESWEMEDGAGFRLAQRWMPLATAGLYIPGGAAAYPSTVLMNAIPAQVAGVDRIVAVTPPQRTGKMNPATLGALHLLGVEEVYQIGGAQAVAALAFGTQSLPRVDIVVGPGNKYVAEAKRLLYGTIRIDMVAGPTEVLILADDSVPAEWIAADMIAQAEHDPDAQSVVVLIGRDDTEALAAELEQQAAQSPRQAVLRTSLENNGAVIVGANIEQALDITARKAPEHLELLLKDARDLVPRIRNAGSIFVGPHSVEAIGDYIAGPNHVLPTGGTARFFSPLSVQDFYKMTQVIECGPQGLAAMGPAAARLADAEGLDGHAQSIRRRLAALEVAT
ncbi:MAG: histidinol dehydrogenase [Sumerlaeia bacterium]